MRKQIENWKVAKLLVTKMDKKVFALRAGQHNVYVRSLVQLTDSSYVADVRAEGIVDVNRLIRSHPELQISRIFKSGLYFPSLEEKVIRGFLLQTVKNALGLQPGKIFYITGQDKRMRDLAYKYATQINDGMHAKGDQPVRKGLPEEERVSFDYDVYDYKLTLMTYPKTVSGKAAIVAIMTGEDMPNTWAR